MVSEESLVSPHAPHEKLFVLEQQRENADQEVNGTLEQALVVLLRDGTLSHCSLVHDSDGL